MKFRSGFVSNSSSSSFLVALPAEQNCEHCSQSNKDLLSILNGLFKKSWAGNECDYECMTLDDCVSNIDSEIEELEKDIGWSKEKTKSLVEIMSNSDAISLFADWLYIQDQYSPRNWRHSKEYGSNDDARDDVERCLERSKIDFSGLLRKKAALEKKRQLLKDTVSDSQELYSFEFGYHTKEYNVIESLITNGTVELIEKITS